MFALKRVDRALSVFHRTRPFARAYHGQFSTTDGQLWKRKLHGLEDFSAAIACVVAPVGLSALSANVAMLHFSNIATGFGHGVLAFEVKPPKTSVSLNEAVRNAWIRLRFLAPIIALRTEDEPGSQGDAFFYSYQSSSSSDVATEWADETIKWHLEAKPLVARNLDFKEIWWGTEKHWNMELHVGHGINGNVQLA